MFHRADGTTVVDTCTGRVLFGVGDVEGARVFGETDLESQYEILFAADHGEDVCARPLVPGSMVVEAPVTRLDELARRVRSVPELRVTLSAPPPPG